MSPAIEILAKGFHQQRLTLPNEKTLQDLIEGKLQAAGVKFAREHALGPKKRPDFLTEEGLAIEVKVDGGQLSILRQLKRYADDANVREILLVTTRRVSVPNELNHKPVFALQLWRNLL